MLNTEKSVNEANGEKVKILVTSATGKTGFQAAVKLLKDGYPVRIFVHSRNDKSSELENSGAEIFIGDLANYADLTEALKDVKRVYYCYPFMPHLLEGTKTFICAAKEQKIEAVVNMGQRLADFDDQKSVHTNQIKESYKFYEESGLNVIHLTPGFFADNMRFAVEFAVQFGLMLVPHGNGKNPPISNEDLGLVIAALLENPHPYFGKKIRPTGPKSLTSKEMAEVFTKVSGRKVRYVNMPLWLFVKGAFKSAKEFGLNAFTISQARYYFKEYQDNRFNIGGETNVVKEIAGKEPDDFETIVKDWIADSPYGKRNFSNWLAAFRKFMMIPFQPVLSVRELEKLNS